MVHQPSRRSRVNLREYSFPPPVTLPPYFPAFILFTYTMSTDMSAGDTPEMREA